MIEGNGIRLKNRKAKGVHVSNRAGAFLLSRVTEQLREIEVHLKEDPACSVLLCLH